MSEETAKPETDDTEGFIEYTTREEYVTLSCMAINTMLQMKQEMDVQMMTKRDQERMNRVIRKALFVIDKQTIDMYDEQLREEGEEEDD